MKKYLILLLVITQGSCLYDRIPSPRIGLSFIIYNRTLMIENKTWFDIDQISIKSKDDRDFGEFIFELVEYEKSRSKIIYKIQPLNGDYKYNFKTNTIYNYEHHELGKEFIGKFIIYDHLSSSSEKIDLLTDSQEVFTSEEY